MCRRVQAGAPPSHEHQQAIRGGQFAGLEAYSLIRELYKIISANKIVLTAGADSRRTQPLAQQSTQFDTTKAIYIISFTVYHQRTSNDIIQVLIFSFCLCVLMLINSVLLQIEFVPINC